MEHISTALAALTMEMQKPTTSTPAMVTWKRFTTVQAQVGAPEQEMVLGLWPILRTVYSRASTAASTRAIRQSQIVSLLQSSRDNQTSE